MNDPVMNDEARHDRECEAERERQEQLRERVTSELNSGLLDDAVIDAVADNPTDAARIAHMVIMCIDTGSDMNDFVCRLSLHIKDFRALLDGVIEQRIEVLS